MPTLKVRVPPGGKVLLRDQSKVLAYDSMDRSQADSRLITLDLDCIRVPRRDVMDSNMIADADAEVDRRYAGAVYRSSELVVAVRLAWYITGKCARRVCGCEWDNIDVMNYVELSEEFDFRRLVFFRFS